MASVTQKWTNIRSAALRTYTTSVEPLVMSAQRPDRHLVNFCLLVVHAILKSAMSLVESRVVNLYLRADFPTSEPDQALDLTGLKLDRSLKSSCHIVINKPSQAEEEAGLRSLFSLSGEEAAASC
jgi:hypothetical protein